MSTIGSYVDGRVKLRSAQELADVNAVKQLHLVMKRSLTGKQLADAFAEAVQMNYPSPTFDAELKMLTDQLNAIPKVDEGHQVRLTHLPGVGFYGDLGGNHRVLIKNPAFSRAVWEIYLGKKNVDDSIKTDLTARLK